MVWSSGTCGVWGLGVGVENYVIFISWTQDLGGRWLGGLGLRDKIVCLNFGLTDLTFFHIFGH